MVEIGILSIHNSLSSSFPSSLSIVYLPTCDISSICTHVQQLNFLFPTVTPIPRESVALSGGGGGDITVIAISVVAVISVILAVLVVVGALIRKMCRAERYAR